MTHTGASTTFLSQPIMIEMWSVTTFSLLLVSTEDVHVSKFKQTSDLTVCRQQKEKCLFGLSGVFKGSSDFPSFISLLLRMKVHS